ncbi:hypothetical protein WJX73_003684 [Symbiochloris irregularis]|uniref:F-box domain-containing protein n=1 Tax=Symbiochloris irregularis TaxID=706552 RepID=A0AAW1NJG4_9CHLO
MALPLPDDVLYNIFRRLGHTDTVQCQRVCKSWNTLLRHPEEHVWETVKLDLSTLCDGEIAGTKHLAAFLDDLKPVRFKVRVEFTCAGHERSMYQLTLLRLETVRWDADHPSTIGLTEAVASMTKLQDLHIEFCYIHPEGDCLRSWM